MDPINSPNPLPAVRMGISMCTSLWGPTVAPLEMGLGMKRTDLGSLVYKMSGALDHHNSLINNPQILIP